MADLPCPARPMAATCTPGRGSRRRGRSWALTIRTQRRHVLKVLRRNPSLKASLGEALGEAYADARDEAAKETDLPLRTFPVDLPYAWNAILDRPFELDPPDEV